MAKIMVTNDLSCILKMVSSLYASPFLTTQGLNDSSPFPFAEVEYA